MMFEKIARWWNGHPHCVVCGLWTLDCSCYLTREGLERGNIKQHQATPKPPPPPSRLLKEWSSVPSFYPPLTPCHPRSPLHKKENTMEIKLPPRKTGSQGDSISDYTTKQGYNAALDDVISLNAPAPKPMLDSARISALGKDYNVESFAFDYKMRTVSGGIGGPVKREQTGYVVITVKMQNGNSAQIEAGPNCDVISRLEGVLQTLSSRGRGL